MEQNNGPEQAMDPEETPRSSSGEDPEEHLEEAIRAALEDESERGEELLWDGSEAELVEDEDAAVYEVQQPGIKLNYHLQPEEVFICLKEGNLTKTTGKRAVVETVILAIAAVYFAYVYFFVDRGAATLAIGIIALLLIGVIWIVPAQGMKRQAKRIAEESAVEVSVYPNVIEIEGSANRADWEIPLDGSSALQKLDHLLILHTTNHKMFCIPKRAVEPAMLPEIEAVLTAGTKPAE